MTAVATSNFSKLPNDTYTLIFRMTDPLELSTTEEEVLHVVLPALARVNSTFCSMYLEFVSTRGLFQKLVTNNKCAFTCLHAGVMSIELPFDIPKMQWNIHLNDHLRRVHVKQSKNHIMPVRCSNLFWFKLQK